MSIMQLFTKILIVDDDSGISGALKIALRDSYEIEIASNGQQALNKIQNQQYGAIILDLELPDFPGIIICQEIRNRGLRVPILIMSGESKVMSKISLLDSGADDYLTKPFSLGELKARLRALIRNSKQPAPFDKKLSVSGLSLNRETHAVSREGISIGLRRKEFALLECLMEHAGSVVTRSTLTQYAWRGDEDPWTNTVDVHIKYLRDKIDRPFETQLIQTVHGLGYRLALIQQFAGERL